MVKYLIMKIGRSDQNQQETIAVCVTLTLMECVRKRSEKRQETERTNAKNKPRNWGNAISNSDGKVPSSSISPSKGKDKGKIGTA